MIETKRKRERGRVRQRGKKRERGRFRGIEKNERDREMIWRK